MFMYSKSSGWLIGRAEKGGLSLKLLSPLLAGLFLLIIFGMAPALVSAPTGNTTPSAKGSSDDTGDLLADIQADDASGASPSAVTTGDGWYTVDKSVVMFIDNFDTSGMSGTVTAAALKVQYSVEAEYEGTNSIKWALDGGSLTSTDIVPADGQEDQVGSYDLYAQGVDTLAKISTLDIEFTNDDKGGPDAVSFDYVWVEVTTNLAPSVPTLSSPSDGSSTSDNTPTFQWQTSTDPEGDIITYWIQVDNDSDFSSPEENVTGLSTSSYTSATELPNDNYSWHVRAVDNNNNQSDWSSTWSLEIAPVAPAFDFSVSASPDNVTLMRNDSTTSTIMVNLVSGTAETVSLSGEWMGTEPTGISASFSPSSVTPTDNSTLTFTTTSTASAGTFTYGVTGTDGGLTRTDNLTVTIVAPPTAPSLVSPENGTAIDTLTPTFEWSDVAGAESYTVEVATDNNFSNVVRTKSAIDNIVTLSEDEKLSYGTLYYWRVRGTNAAGSGDWSSAWSFTAKLAAPKVMSITIEGWVAYTNKDNVQLMITAQYADKMSFSDDGVVWSDWESFKVLVFYVLPPSDGLKYVYVRVKDNVGDISQAGRGSITLDQTLPNTTHLPLPSDGAEGYKGSVVITLTSVDETSGVASIKYRIDDGEWGNLPIGVGNKGSFVISTDGTHTVEYYSTDAAWNTEGTKTFEVTVYTPTAIPPILSQYWWAILSIVVVAIAVPVFFIRKHMLEKGLIRNLGEIRREIQEIPKLKKEAARGYYTEGTLTRETYNELIKKYSTRLEELRSKERELQPKVKKIKGEKS